jgi:hypothetical protein
MRLRMVGVFFARRAVRWPGRPGRSLTGRSHSRGKGCRTPRASWGARPLAPLGDGGMSRRRAYLRRKPGRCATPSRRGWRTRWAGRYGGTDALPPGRRGFTAGLIGPRHGVVAIRRCDRSCRARMASSIDAQVASLGGESQARLPAHRQSTRPGMAPMQAVRTIPFAAQSVCTDLNNFLPRGKQRPPGLNPTRIGGAATWDRGLGGAWHLTGGDLR